MTQSRQTHSLLPGLLAQTIIQFRRQQPVKFPFLRSIKMDIRQPERQCWFFYFCQHVGKETGVGCLTHAQPDLRHQITERHRHSQVFFFPCQISPHFTVHHFHCFMIANQVMVQFQQEPAAIGFLRHHKAQQWGLTQVKTIMARIKTLT